MGVCVVGTLYQQFIGGFHTEIEFSKKQVVSGKTPFFVGGQLGTSHPVCLSL